MIRTKFPKDPKYDYKQGQSYTVRGPVSQFGTTFVYIICPLCKATVKAYVWSLAGSGKKCYCGAMHTSFGVTYPKYKPQ